MPSQYASVVGVELDVKKVLVVGAYNDDCGGESYFDLCVNGGQHCISMGAGQGDDEACEL